ncbi:MAG: DUF1569 domain-containing protein [Bacteroidota bacterium]|nr:DUF1569 domain-containing protein [Bacteroidota bacterium]
MNKNLFTKSAVEGMVQRIEKLQPETYPQWGKMNATEMLLHCNSIHERLLTPATASGKRTSLKQLLIRTVVLYVMPHYPKNVTAPKPLQVSGKISVTEFENQKEKCLQLLHQFLQHNQEVSHYHPYFGNLNKKEWGRTSWKHLDHHLRQFGV